MASDWAITKAEAIVTDGLNRGAVHPSVYRRARLAVEFANALREARAEGMEAAAKIADSVRQGEKNAHVVDDYWEWRYNRDVSLEIRRAAPSGEGDAGT